MTDAKGTGGSNASESKTSLEVNLSNNEGSAVLGLTGQLVSAEIMQFRRACNHADKQGLNDYVVDLSEVDAVDGYGLASLVGLLSRSSANGGQVVLCGINPDLRQRFEVTHCDMIFETAFTVAKAIELLAKERQ